MTTSLLREIIPGWTFGEGAHARLDEDLLVRAYRFSEEAHRGQKRNSGEPYITHAVEVAKILAELQLDTTTVVSGLIHDVVEDTKIGIADIEREFGAETAAIVDGLTKIAKLPSSGSKQDRQVEDSRSQPPRARVAAAMGRSRRRRWTTGSRGSGAFPCLFIDGAIER